MNSFTAQTPIAGSPRQVAKLLILAGAVALFAGCGSTESHVVSAPPPANPVVVQQPAPIVVANASQMPAGTVVVTQAPPVAQQEVAQARPTSDHVWVPGYWTWRNSRYEWMMGRWELPPRTNAVWVAPRWERLNDGTYRFYEGYWN